MKVMAFFVSSPCYSEERRIFYQKVAVDVPEADEIKPIGTLGVDLSIVNLAMDLESEMHSGESTHNRYHHIAALRSILRSYRTWSVKKHPKRLSRKESRFYRVGGFFEPHRSTPAQASSERVDADQ
jgi:hypothetical protein